MKEDWSKQPELYTEQQVYSILAEIGVDVRSETDNVWLSYCPFHRNVSTPSFAVNKESGLYFCHNPSCQQKGTLLNLVMRTGNITIFPAKRIISKYESENKAIERQVTDIFDKKLELPTFPYSKMNEMSDAFWNSPAQEYMQGRGFTDKTMAYFQVGYSASKGLVAIPVHDWESNLVGVIGRTIVGKRFENSKKIPTRKTLFNIHRVRKYESVIIVESSMDAMRIHQAGFPNVVATNGGFFTESHRQLLNRYFNEIIIMTDNDDPKDHVELLCKRCPGVCTGHSPGRALGEHIASDMRHKRIRWASFDCGVVYPHGAKDAGDMEEVEIAQCINNAVSSVQYELWKREIADFSIS